MLLQPPYTRVHLQRVSEELVHLGDAARDAEVDRSVTNLDNEATDDVGVNLGALSALMPAPSASATDITGQPTWLVTLSFLPWPTYSDLATAFSSLERVLLSSC